MDWWKEESAWESRSIPIGGFMLSPRIMAVFTFFTLTGTLLGMPFRSLPVRGMLLGFFMLLGTALSFKKVNAVPLELQLLFILFYRKPKNDGVKIKKPQVLQEESVQEMYADSAAPLTFSGKVKVKEPGKLILYVDGRERASVTVSPEKPEYRIYYLPDAGDIGTHTVTLVLGRETVQDVKLTVKPRGGVSLIDAKK